MTTATATLSRIRHVARESFVRNSALLMANYVISGLLGFAFWALAARMLPADTVGTVSALVAGLGFAASAAGVGMPNTVVRYLHTEADQRAFVLAAVGLVTATSLVVAGAIVGVPGSFGLPLGPTSRILVVALVVAMAVGPVVDAVIVGFRVTGSIVVKNALAGAVRIAALPLLAALGADQHDGLMWALLLSTALAALISFTVGLRQARSVPDGGSGRLPWSALAGKITFSGGNYASMLVSIAPLAFTPIIALTLLGPAAGAYTTAALLLVTALNAIPTTISQSLFAELSTKTHDTRVIVRRALRGTYTLVAPVVGIVLVIAPFVLAVFGPEYTAATWCLRLMALGSLLGAFNYVADVVINAAGRIVAFTAVNTAGSAMVLVATVVGATHSLTGLGLGWLVGQGCYSVLAGAALLRRNA
ncbi:lipopolysaccharide biosynthesis protein [Actinomycetospora termitidis]|uniref:Polysaccharide biosynthesis protein n=1 Tax=Actinomycetospora termitidis TaxID=3053470 RepID=A0ABT7MFU4_9PSEU|nr:hypothetical protein [Actinomycetospora sp. Odt1-22]MDL5159547.1 hypothetical protein [Actinomycetospora sp. Odt1-22]